MVGTRYNVGKKEIKLTCERFPNRIENKRYLVLLLENLVRVRKLTKEILVFFKENKILYNPIDVLQNLFCSNFIIDIEL